MSVVYLKCCRVWPIVPGNRVGRCGICGERPEERPSDAEIIAHLEQRITELASRK